MNFDLLIIPWFGWVRQVPNRINQFYQYTHTYSGVLLSFSAPTLYNKTDGVLGIFGLVSRTPWLWVRNLLYIFSGPRLAYKKCGGDRIDPVYMLQNRWRTIRNIWEKSNCDTQVYSWAGTRYRAVSAHVWIISSQNFHWAYMERHVSPFSCEILTCDGHHESE